MDLSIEEFVVLRNMIYERTGMQFGENKIYYFKKRIQKRLEQHGLQKVNDYIRFLKFQDNENHEFQELINLITINETYFFREFNQLEVFAEMCLPEVEELKKSRGDRIIKVFSAACSSGEEPYTLAIILREMLEDFHKWNITVKAVDIDENVLEIAQRGEYSSRSVKDVPPVYLEKYFQPNTKGTFTLNPEIKNMVSFDHVNLADRKALRNETNYDFIFCRNMLIYFDDHSRKQVIERFYTMLNKGGYIFLGHAESLSRVSTAFKIKRFNGYSVYQA